MSVSNLTSKRETGIINNYIVSLSKAFFDILSRKQERQRLDDKSFHKSDVSNSVLSTKLKEHLIKLSVALFLAQNLKEVFKIG